MTSYIEQNDLLEREEIIRKMAKISDYLKDTPTEYKNNLYQQIENSVNQYIREFCEHKIVQDSIDISPTRSQRIVYCEICETDFSQYYS